MPPKDCPLVDMESVVGGGASTSNNEIPPRKGASFSDGFALAYVLLGLCGPTISLIPEWLENIHSQLN